MVVRLVEGTEVKIEWSAKQNKYEEEMKISVNGDAFILLKGERAKIKFTRTDRGGGAKYDGIVDREEGKLSGKAKIHFGDGSVFGGEMVDGFAHGKGKIAYASGEVWEGVFDENEKEGKARMIVKRNGEQVGEWVGEYIGGHVYEPSSVYSKRIWLIFSDWGSLYNNKFKCLTKDRALLLIQWKLI